MRWLDGSMARWLWVLTVVLVVPSSAAANDDCEELQGIWATTASRSNTFVVNPSGFNAEFGTTSGNASRLVQLGAATWNLHGSSGTFRQVDLVSYIGSDQTFCDSNVDGIVTMGNINVPGGPWRCELGHPDSVRGWAARAPCNSDKWWINICRSNTIAGRTWTTSSDPNAGEIDVLQTLAHEFGHVAGLDHPSNDFCSESEDNGGAVMCPTGYSNEQSRQRDVYLWDTRCMAQEVDVRDHSVRRQVESGGTFGSTSVVSPSAAFRADLANRPFGFRVMNRIASNGSVRITRYQSYTATSPSRTLNTNFGGHAVSTAFWPDYFFVRPTFYAYSSTHDWDEAFRARQILDVENFSSSPSYHFLESCAFGAPPCSVRDPVRTAHRLAHAYNDFSPSEGSIVAWVNQNRTSAGSDREVRVARVTSTPNVLEMPWGTGNQSSIPPAVACRAYSVLGGSYDCLFAYVDPSDVNQVIRLRPFYITGSGNYIAGSSFSSGRRTNHGVSLWHREGTWWMAYLSASTTNHLRVRIYKSTNGGSTWSFSQTLGFSFQVPAIDSRDDGLGKTLFSANAN